MAASNYHLTVKNYNGYGKLRLSSAPRHVYTYPGSWAPYRLYELYVPMPKHNIETKTEITVAKPDLNTDGELQGGGKKAPEKNEDIAELLKYPIKISEEEFKQKRSQNGGAKTTKAKKPKLEDEFAFN
jgi:hypothetical protein